MFYTYKIHNYLNFATPACILQVFSLHLWWTSIQVEGKELVGREYDHEDDDGDGDGYLQINL